MKKTLGLLCAAAVLAFTSAQAAITLNLKDADISTLIATVSEVTGKNFIVDSRVKGKVTVISSKPMSSAGLYETFLGVLQVNGFAAVPDGQAIKIVPEANARSDGGVRIHDGKGLPIDDVVTYVFTLENISASQMIAVMRPLLSQWAHFAAYTPANQIIVSDRAASVARLGTLLKQMDQASDRTVELVKLEHAAASEVVRILTALAQQDKTQDASAKPAAIIADERSNSVLVGGDKAERLKLLEIIKQLDQPLKQDGATQVVYLRYASAENLAPILEGYAQQVNRAGSTPATGGAAAAAPAAAGGNTESRVIADKDTNALIITAAPKVMRQVRDVIAQLDIQRAQVLVEAIIAEVSANKSSQIGVDWAVFNSDRIAAAGLFGINPSSLATAGATGGTAGAALGVLGQGATIIGGKDGGDTGTSFALILKALQGDGDSNVLSTPTLVTTDNEEAKFSAAREVPFLTGQFSSTGTTSSTGTVNPFQTIERKDVGLTLAVTPQINEGGNIALKIDLEVSSLDAGTSTTLQAITNKRTVTNVVNVQDGQTLVIGGLIDEQLQETESGVPFLSKIPLFGSLFSSRSVNKQKRNLMVFIKPTVLRKQSDGDYYTRKKYDAVRQAQIDASSGAVPLIGGKRPVLDKLEVLSADRPVVVPPPEMPPPAEPSPEAVAEPEPKPEAAEAPAAPPAEVPPPAPAPAPEAP